MTTPDLSSSFEQLLLERSLVLQDLRETKRAYANAPGVDEWYSKKRHVNKKARTFAAQKNHMNHMRGVMKAIDSRSGGHLSGNKITTFLDLGAAPGGSARLSLT